MVVRLKACAVYAGEDVTALQLHQSQFFWANANHEIIVVKLQTQVQKPACDARNWQGLVWRSSTRTLQAKLLQYLPLHSVLELAHARVAFRRVRVAVVEQGVAEVITHRLQIAHAQVGVLATARKWRAAERCFKRVAAERTNHFAGNLSTTVCRWCLQATPSARFRREHTAPLNVGNLGWFAWFNSGNNQSFTSGHSNSLADTHLLSRLVALRGVADVSSENVYTSSLTYCTYGSQKVDWGIQHLAGTMRHQKNSWCTS